MINKRMLGRIKKALAAGFGALVGELALLALVGGPFDETTVPPAVAFAIAAGWAAYKVKNKRGVNEIKAELAEAEAALRP